MDTADAFGSLFDDAMEAAPLTAASQPQPCLAEWNLDVISGFATMNDEPEPALPVTDGAEEDADKVAAMLARQMQPQAVRRERIVAQMEARSPSLAQQAYMTKQAGFPLCAKGCNQTLSAEHQMVNTAAGLAHAQCPTAPVMASGRPETPEERGRRLLAYVDASMSGQEIPGPNPFEHLLAGGTDNEIAAAAQQVLTNPKTALKNYDLAERNAIINEGEGTEAANLDRLDISGTHYEIVEAQHQKEQALAEDEDLWMLNGDPNDMGDL